MDADYDAIVLGTGLKECLLSTMLTSTGKKVLHLDRNRHYGGETSSVTPLEKFFAQFSAPPPDDATYGRGVDWYVDLIPKFMMANGTLAQLLMATGASRYLYFRSVEGCYFYYGGKIEKVPVNKKEAYASQMMGIFEKRRFKNFLSYVRGVDADAEASSSEADINTCTMQQLYDRYGLEKSTQDFTGHVLALHHDDAYLHQSAATTLRRLKLYASSLALYGKSPYLYPLYGIGDLPQSLARVSHRQGGVFMMDKAVESIVLRWGKAAGVRVGKRVASCRQVYCDPSYAVGRVKKKGAVVRCVCILDHPIPDTNLAGSTHIIIPQNQVGRRSDIYVALVSYAHHVTPKGWYLAMITTAVETDDPEAEIQPALDLIGAVRQKFVSVCDYWEPLDDGVSSQIFVSTSYDATIHFETACRDALDMYRRGTGRDFDYS